jgi:hypothetical protein
MHACEHLTLIHCGTVSLCPARTPTLPLNLHHPAPYMHCGILSEDNVSTMQLKVVHHQSNWHRVSCEPASYFREHPMSQVCTTCCGTCNITVQHYSSWSTAELAVLFCKKTQLSGNGACTATENAVHGRLSVSSCSPRSPCLIKNTTQLNKQSFITLKLHGRVSSVLSQLDHSPRFPILPHARTQDPRVGASQQTLHCPRAF